MTDTQIYLLLAFFLGLQVSATINRWKLPLIRGEDYFLRVHVGAEFYRGPGRLVLDAYRRRLFLPLVVELPGIAMILAFGHPVYLLYLMVGVAIVSTANGIWAVTVARAKASALARPVAEQPATAMAIPLGTRRLANYTHRRLELLLAVANVASMVWLVRYYLSFEAPHRFQAVLGVPILLLYMHGGLLLAKWGAVVSRTALPKYQTADQLELREEARRFSIDTSDSIRVLCTLMLVLYTSRLAFFHGARGVSPIFYAAVAAMLAWTIWYARRRNALIGVMGRIKPAAMPDALERDDAVSGWICYRPMKPVLLLKGRHGYALNLGSRRTQAAALYMVGLAAVFGWLCLPARAADTKIAGDWEGKLAGQLRLVLHVKQAPDGSMSGVMDSLDQGNAHLNADTISLSDAGAVKIEFKSIAAIFEANLLPDASEMRGTWKQGTTALPLVFRRPGAAPKTTLQPLTRGKVALKPCIGSDKTTEGLCGTYSVFENRQTRAGRKIDLRIMILPAATATPAPDPVFPLAGGPGQSAVDDFLLAGYLNNWRKQRDVVLVDQRGTGKSNLLACDVKDPESAQSIVGELHDLEKLRACRAVLEAKADLTQYTTSNFVDDLDEVREALGYGKINVFGGSYGSRAAMVYLRRHPATVRTLTLDAVAPPEHKLPLVFSKTIQAAIQRMIADCAADAPCHKMYPNLETEFQTILTRLEKAPARFEMENYYIAKTQPVSLSRGAFISDLRLILYSPPAASSLPYLLHKAFSDQWEPLAQVYFALTTQTEPHIARGLSFSVLCAEDVPAITEEEIRTQTAGTWLGDFQVRHYQEACKLWPKGSVPADYYAPLRSDVPVLLIAGALDPATPPSAAREAARGLTNSRVVEIPQGTHLTSSPCMDNLIGDFVAKGSVADLNTACVAQIGRPPFVIR